MMGKLDWLDWTAPAVVALLVAGMSWAWGRTVNGGKIFSPFQRGLLLFAVLFTLGAGYLIVIATLFRWSDQVMFVLIGAWGGTRLGRFALASPSARIAALTAINTRWTNGSPRVLAILS